MVTDVAMIERSVQNPVLTRPSRRVLNRTFVTNAAPWMTIVHATTPLPTIKGTSISTRFIAAPPNEHVSSARYASRMPDFIHFGSLKRPLCDATLTGDLFEISIH